jgi:hypothetical protein
VARHGDFLLTRGKNKKWVVRNLKGQFVNKSQRSSVLKGVFGRKKPKTKIVRYTRTFALKKDEQDPTPETLVDVIVQEREPIGFTDEEMKKKMKSRKMTTKMLEKLEKDKVYLEKYNHLIPDNYYAPNNIWGGVDVRGTKVDSWVGKFRPFSRG